MWWEFQKWVEGEGSEQEPKEGESRSSALIFVSSLLCLVDKLRLGVLVDLVVDLVVLVVGGAEQE